MTEEGEEPKGKDVGDEVAVKEMEQNGDGDCMGERVSVDANVLQDMFNSDLLCDEHGNSLLVSLCAFI